MEIKIDSPGMFLCAIMGMKRITNSKLQIMTGINNVQICNYKADRVIPGTKICYKIAKALNIDPLVYNAICSEYKMKKLIEKMEKQDYISKQGNFLVLAHQGRFLKTQRK